MGFGKEVRGYKTRKAPIGGESVYKHYFFTSEDANLDISCSTSFLVTYYFALVLRRVSGRLER